MERQFYLRIPSDTICQALENYPEGRIAVPMKLSGAEFLASKGQEYLPQDVKAVLAREEAAKRIRELELKNAKLCGQQEALAVLMESMMPSNVTGENWGGTKLLLEHSRKDFIAVYHNLCETISKRREEEEREKEEMR
jgi:hypothetical protein